MRRRFVNSDEMVKPEWMDDQFAHETMRYTLTKAAMVAARHKVNICIEPHGVYTKTATGLMRIVHLVDSPWIGVNWDTGNSYLAGVEDPYDGLARVKTAVRHVHAKDIDFKQSSCRAREGDRHAGRLRLRRRGGRLGQSLSILDTVKRDLFLSVECGTIDQAERSLEFLKKTVGNRLAAD